MKMRYLPGILAVFFCSYSGSASAELISGTVTNIDPSGDEITLQPTASPNDVGTLPPAGVDSSLTTGSSLSSFGTGVRATGTGVSSTGTGVSSTGTGLSSTGNSNTMTSAGTAS